jgi:mannose-binding lectin 2
MTLLTRIFAVIVLVATFVCGQQDFLLAPGQQVVDENGQKSVPLRTHSLYPPYLDSDLQSRW